MDAGFESFGGVVGVNGAGFLEDDLAGINALVDEVDGHAGFFFVIGEDGFVNGLAVEVFAAVFGNQ